MHDLISRDLKISRCRVVNDSKLAWQQAHLDEDLYRPFQHIDISGDLRANDVVEQCTLVTAQHHDQRFVSLLISASHNVLYHEAVRL